MHIYMVLAIYIYITWNADDELLVKGKANDSNWSDKHPGRKSANRRQHDVFDKQFC